MFRRRRRRRRRLGDRIIWIFQVVIILGLVSVGGLKLFQHYKIKQVLEMSASNLSDFGNLSWQDLSVAFDGTVEITDLEFESDGGESFEADLVRLHTPGIFYIIGIDSEAVLPIGMQGEIQGFTSDIDSVVSPTSVNWAVTGNPFEAHACGDIKRFDSPQLIAMGLSGNKRIDVDFSYEIEPPNKVTVNWNQYLGEVGNYRLEIGLSTDNMRSLMNLTSMSDMKLTGMTFLVDVADFNRVRNDFCARERGINRSQFIAEHLQSIRDETRSMGLEFNQEFYDQYWDFTHGRGSWTILSNQEDKREVLVRNIRFSSFPDMMDDLILYGAITSTDHEILEVTTLANYKAPGQSTVVTVTDPVSGEVTTNTVVAVDSDPVQSQPVASADSITLPFFDIKPEELMRYKDYQVRLSTLNNRIYSGYVDDIKGRQVILDTYVTGQGQAMIPISIDQIARVVVLRHN